MSIVQDAANLIAARGCATVDDILPDMPGCTRAQVIQALQWARYQGLLERDELRRKSGDGAGRGTALPCLYRPRRKPMVSSVWALAL